jgi:hypothetical protein
MLSLKSAFDAQSPKMAVHRKLNIAGATDMAQHRLQLLPTLRISVGSRAIRGSMMPSAANLGCLVPECKTNFLVGPPARVGEPLSDSPSCGLTTNCCVGGVGNGTRTAKYAICVFDDRWLTLSCSSRQRCFRQSGTF